MNRDNLNAIFKAYIENFEFINSEHDENYKWEIASQFQDFDLDAEDFHDMLTKMWKASENLIDNAKQLPFYALLTYSKQEPETVRQMFKDLFIDDTADLATKQKRILSFIDSSEQLREKYLPYSHLYINNQRSVMQYLFLRYPESNYGYKASQAKRFADCIGFYEDWGPMSDFKLDVYYKMCNQLVEEIKKNDALMKTHMSRYQHTNRRMHSDINLHILAFDIIYSSQTYDFYVNTTFKPINAQAKKLHLEQVAKAKELAQAEKMAEKENQMLIDAKKVFSELLKSGTVVKHRTYGKGIVETCDGTQISIFFSEKNKTVKLGLALSIGNNFLSCDEPEFADKLKLYQHILQREDSIKDIFKIATNNLRPYLEYLEEDI